MVLRNTLFLGLGMFLVACGNLIIGPPFSEAPAPLTKSDMAAVYIYREYAEPESSKASIYIDGNEVIALPQNAFTWFYVTPGTHHIVYKWNGDSSMPVSTYDKQFVKGNLYAYEMIGTVADLRPRSFLRTIETSTAIKTMRQCCKYVKPLMQTVK